MEFFKSVFFYHSKTDLRHSITFLWWTSSRPVEWLNASLRLPHHTFHW